MLVQGLLAPRVRCCSLYFPISWGKCTSTRCPTSQIKMNLKSEWHHHCLMHLDSFFFHSYSFHRMSFIFPSCRVSLLEKVRRTTFYKFFRSLSVHHNPSLFLSFRIKSSYSKSAVFWILVSPVITRNFLQNLGVR